MMELEEMMLEELEVEARIPMVVEMTEMETIVVEMEVIEEEVGESERPSPFAIEEPTGLHDWEILSDSETNAIYVEGIIHSDYFVLGSNNLQIKEDGDHEGIESIEENLMHYQIEIDKESSFPANDATTEISIEGIVPDIRNFDVVDTNKERGVGETDEGGSFLVDEPKMEVGVEDVVKGDTFRVDDSKLDLSFEGTKLIHQNSCVVDCKHEDGEHGVDDEIQKGDSFLVDYSKMKVGIEEADSITQNSDQTGNMKESRRESNNENSQELASDSSIEMSNSLSTSAVNGENKVLMSWKLPLDILKLCASRVRPVRSISIAAAVIGILMVRKRLYKMKRKSRSIPLNVSFEEKATSHLLVRAERLNEVIVRRVSIIRSPLLPAGGLVPWSTVGQL